MRYTTCLLAVLSAVTVLAGRAFAQAAAPAPAVPVAPEPGGRFVRGSADASAGLRSRRQALVSMDEGTRSLIITTDPTTNEQIKTVLKALDQPVPQALIKVLFLEVTHTKNDDLGVDISYDHTNSDGERSVLSSLFGAFPNETGGGLVTLQQNDLQVTLRALGKVGKTNVLSRPSILARNNEEATITIGEEMPFVTNSRITDNGDTINTVEYQDIGIILTVTPHIGSDGRIELDVAPQITTRTADTVPISNTVSVPVIAKRSAETHVVVPSGKTIVIGGLMEDLDTETVKKVPILGDLWLVGTLFKRTLKEKTKRELLIFLTPTVVDSGAGLMAVSNGERDDAQLIQEETTPRQRQRFLKEAPAAPAPPQK